MNAARVLHLALEYAWAAGGEDAAQFRDRRARAMFGDEPWYPRDAAPIAPIARYGDGDGVTTRTAMWRSW